MTNSIEVAIEEFRAAQFAFRQRSKDSANARDLLRGCDIAQNKALTRMDDAKSALFAAIADTE